MAIHIDMAKRFAANQRGSGTNHTVTSHGDVSTYILFGNVIATLDHKTNTLKLYNCGYETVSTAKPLNAILAEVPFARKWKLKSWVLTDPHGNKHEWVEGFTIRPDNAVGEDTTSGLAPALGDR
jgi:hypothetical protein